jgi:phosphoglycerate kinase
VTALPDLASLDVAGRSVLVRADLNVPFDDEGRIADDFRIRAAIPTLHALRERGAKVIVCSHLGRPKGFDPRFSMAPVGAALADLGGFRVVVAPDVAGPGAVAAAAVADDAVVLLENTRFEPGETSNDSDLADRLAGLADFFVLDAFGSAHRAHASTVGVAERLRSAAGLLLVAEVAAFDRILGDPDRPFVVALGGAKVSDKLGVIKALLPKVDVMLIGGAMCFTLLAAEGYEVGDSLVEDDRIDEVAEILGSEHGGRISLPTDIVVGEAFAEDTPHVVASAQDLPDEGMGLDIGPEAAARFATIIGGADTVFWNGPMGVAEWPAFAGGTRTVAEALATSGGYTVVGGGDSVAALRALGLERSVSHLSTGGGAGLELIEQGTLPGLEALRRWADGSAS